MSDIHPTAIIDDGAKIGQNVKIGPYCHIGAEVVLGDRVVLKAHVVVDGKTVIGEDTVIYPFASIGSDPQDLKFHGESSSLIIGARNRIREHVTINPGTEGGGMKTIIGDDGLFMVGAHVAHDCILGNHIILANNATLAGHVEVDDFVVVGGLSAVHQFVHIGKGAMIGGMTGVDADIIPHGLVMGERGFLRGLNIIGMRRQGFDKKTINEMRQLFDAIFYGEDDIGSRLDNLIKDYKDDEHTSEWLRFISKSLQNKRRLVHPKS